MHGRAIRPPAAPSRRLESDAPAAGRADAVLALQRTYGNRTVAGLVRRLARAPVVVKGGVETKIVSPAVKKLLEEKGLRWAGEVSFELLDAEGKAVLVGRTDVVFRSNRTQQLVFTELKGLKVKYHGNQARYIPLFEGTDGAQVRILHTQEGNLVLPSGTLEHVRGENFLMVSSKQMTTFAKVAEEEATGKAAVGTLYDRGRLTAFHSQEEFEKVLERMGVATKQPSPQPKIRETPKPLKPHKPSDTPPPNPLHDPPPRGMSQADPISGPPEHPARKKPNPKPQPYDEGKSWKPPPKPAEPAPAKAEQTIVKVDEAAVKAEQVVAKDGLAVRGAAKLGEIAEGLLPGPLDAVMLMVNFVSAFEEAKAEIRRRNSQEGFEIGFAASLLGAEPPWLNWHAKRHKPVADVETEILGAVGLGEREFNKGLDAGNAIGWALPFSARQPLLLTGLNALAAEGFTTDQGSRDLLSLRTVANLSRVLRWWISYIQTQFQHYVMPIGRRSGWVQGATNKERRFEKRAMLVRARSGESVVLVEDEWQKGYPDGWEYLDYARRVESVPEWMEALALAKTKREFGSVEIIEQNK